MMYNGRTEMVGKAFVGLVVLLVVFGMVSALAFLDYNPWKLAADARRIDVDTQYLEQQNQLKLAEQMLAGEIEREKLDFERQAQRVYYDEWIALQPGRAQEDMEQLLQAQAEKTFWPSDLIDRLSLILGAATLILLGILAGILLPSWRMGKTERFMVSQPPETSPVQKIEEPVILSVHGDEHKINIPEDLWQSPDFRRLARETARRQEREARAKSQQAYSPQASRKLHQSKETKKGDQPWDNLPMAW